MLPPFFLSRPNAAFGTVTYDTDRIAYTVPPFIAVVRTVLRLRFRVGLPLRQRLLGRHHGLVLPVGTFLPRIPRYGYALPFKPISQRTRTALLPDYVEPTPGCLRYHFSGSDVKFWRTAVRRTPHPGGSNICNALPHYLPGWFTRLFQFCIIPQLLLWFTTFATVYHHVIV